MSASRQIGGAAAPTPTGVPSGERLVGQAATGGESFSELDLDLKFANFAFAEHGLLLGYGAGLAVPLRTEGEPARALTSVEPFLNLGYKKAAWEVETFARFGIPTSGSDGVPANAELGTNLSVLRHFGERLQALLEMDTTSPLGGGDDPVLADLTPGVKVQPRDPATPDSAHREHLPPMLPGGRCVLLSTRRSRTILRCQDCGGPSAPRSCEATRDPGPDSPAPEPESASQPLTMQGLRTFFAELRRRRVYRVAIAYLAVAFGVLQGADVLVPALHLPGWTMTLLAVLVILGLPVALVLAWAFDITPEGVRRTAPAAHATPGAPASTGRLARGVATGIGGLALVAGGWVIWRHFSPPAGGGSLDPNVVAVLPFRVAGAEPSLRYMREGMLDLLATKLGGESGPRAVDPRSLVSAWRQMVGSEDDDLPPDSARVLARRLHAGRLILGELVSTPGRVVLSASLYGVADHDTPQPVSVEGPPDSIPALVDRLAASLLSIGAGEERDRIASLTSTSLPALRAYLDGQALYRRADFADAEQSFRRAVELDSTFALAALGIYQATRWGVSESNDPEALARTWRFRDRLDPRDLAFLGAVAGPRYPGRSSLAERLAGWQDAVGRMPDRAEAWFELGDLLLHDGRLIDIDRPLERAADAFQHCVRLDPTFGAALGHLADIAAMTRDTASFRRYTAQRRDLKGLYLWFARWESGEIFGDPAAARLVRDSLDRVGLDELSTYLMLGELFAAGDSISPEIASRLVPRARSPQERAFAFRALHDYALNAGQPARALRLTDSLSTPDDASVPLRVRITDALFWGGDTTAAAAAARELAARAAAAGAGSGARWSDGCTLAQWRLAHGQPPGDAEIAQRRDAAGTRTAGDSIGSRLCAELLEAWRAQSLERPDARARLERLDSLLATGPSTAFSEQADFAAARLLEAAGDRNGALRAVRRRPINVNGPPRLSAHLREEGRLAALTGDRDGAIAAYRHFLYLQSDPEPAVRPEVERVRAELARLVDETR